MDKKKTCALIAEYHPFVDLSKIVRFNTKKSNLNIFPKNPIFGSNLMGAERCG